MASAPTPIDDFVALSAALTGIDGSQLRPQLDTFENAEEYLAYATAHGGAAFVQLMQLYDANRGLAPAALAALVLEQSGDTISYMAKTVMLMWYLGAWYEPAALQTYHDAAQKSPPDPAPFPPPFIVISSNAYTQSWVWRVGQSHPMGYSTWRFGYWHTPPAALNDFIGKA
jgi:hypothetical protein